MGATAKAANSKRNFHSTGNVTRQEKQGETRAVAFCGKKWRSREKSFGNVFNYKTGRVVLEEEEEEQNPPPSERRRQTTFSFLVSYLVD
jgi:hypothetical protein